MKTERIQIYLITLLSAALVIAAAFAGHFLLRDTDAGKVLKVGFIYVGDTITGYTNNFVHAQEAIEKQFDGQVEIITKFNVAESLGDGALQELVDAGCELIFTTSFGYSESAKKFAEKYPQIQFCQATGINANEEPVLRNYHTFMGEIYQGRYIAGVVAGMKLQELIENGEITPEQAKIGYVGAYPYAEVISGYTAFFLGVRSVTPSAVMTVKYTDSWENYLLEKKCAQELIREGCVIISQHSDTSGPAVACEETDRSQVVYYVSYNESMSDVAPTTYLTGSKINWKPYMTGAVQAVLSGRSIESVVAGTVNGNDLGAGFEEGWVQMLEINDFTAAEGTRDCVEKLIREFQKGKIQVFQGEYTGVNPYDPSDVIDLRGGFQENETSSAPAFCYILDDVITVE